MYNVGDTVGTKHGFGVITAIDNTTYCIVLYIVKFTSGEFIGDTLALMSCELLKG